MKQYKYNFISDMRILQGITLFRAIASSKAEMFSFPSKKSYTSYPFFNIKIQSIKNEKWRYNLISDLKILQGIPLFQAVASLKVDIFPLIINKYLTLDNLFGITMKTMKEKIIEIQFD